MRPFTPDSESLTDADEDNPSIPLTKISILLPLTAKDTHRLFAKQSAIREHGMQSKAAFARKTAKLQNDPISLLPQIGKTVTQRSLYKKCPVITAPDFLSQVNILSRPVERKLTYESLKQKLNVCSNFSNIAAYSAQNLLKFVMTVQEGSNLSGTHPQCNWSVNISREIGIGLSIKIWSEKSLNPELVATIVQEANHSVMLDEDVISYTLPLVLMNGNPELQKAVTQWIQYEFLSKVKRLEFTEDNMRSILEVLVLGMDLKLRPYLAIIAGIEERMLTSDKLENMQSMLFQRDPSDPGFFNQKIDSLFTNTLNVIKTNYAFISKNGSVQFIGGIPVKTFKVLLSYLSNIETKL
ncbi:hypothetical protein HDU79_002299 [Rhizoclosmatium sp. JEL0117]|nr:hypothetical protein HDU79_002299 [Rhizoclosmatium sp. JEL0117]